jgi:hypothetical protein
VPGAAAPMRLLASEKPGAGRGCPRPASIALRAVRVGEVRPAIYASREYLARNGVPRTPRDLGDHRVIACTAVTPIADRWRFHGKQGIQAGKVAPLGASGVLSGFVKRIEVTDRLDGFGRGNGGFWEDRGRALKAASRGRTCNALPRLPRQGLTLQTLFPNFLRFLPHNSHNHPASTPKPSDVGNSREDDYS